MTDTKHHSMTECEVGMFRLPGIVFDRNQISEELANDMEQWSKSNNCGTRMTERLWSFKSEKKRGLFVIRWSEDVERETREREQH